MNWSVVSISFPPDARRYDVPHTLYGDVAMVKPVEIRFQLLELAEKHQWTLVQMREERRKYASKSPDKYGKPIKVDGLNHAPINEQGVVFLFGLLSKQLGFSVDAIRQAFPDCIAKRKILRSASQKRAEEWEVVRIEFEFLSSEFRRHGHESSQCDLIVCWQHDWPECPIEFIELERWIEDNRMAD